MSKTKKPPVLDQNTEGEEEEGEDTAADARCYLEAFYRQVPSRVRDFIASTATSTVNDNIPGRMKAFRKVEVAKSGDNPNYLAVARSTGMHIMVVEALLII